MGVSKTSDHIKIHIKIPQASSKAQNQDLKDMDGLCTFKIKLEAKVRQMGVPKTSDYI